MATDARMTEAEYRRARGDLRAHYGSQALAALFVRSGWSLEHLAAIEGKTKSSISQHVAFGRFLGCMTTALTPQGARLRATLTESQFRPYWRQTKAIRSSHERCVAVQRALEAELGNGRSRPTPTAIGAAIKATCADGKWHLLSVIVDRVRTVAPQATVAEVQRVLDRMVRRQTYGLVGQKEKGAKEWRYRLLVGGPHIPLRALMHELGPLLAGLEAEGRKNSVTASPPTVAHLTFQIRQLLERLTTETHHE